MSTDKEKLDSISNCLILLEVMLRCSSSITIADVKVVSKSIRDIIKEPDTTPSSSRVRYYQFDGDDIIVSVPQRCIFYSSSGGSFGLQCHDCKHPKNEYNNCHCSPDAIDFHDGCPLKEK